MKEEGEDRTGIRDRCRIDVCFFLRLRGKNDGNLSFFDKKAMQGNIQ